MHLRSLPLAAPPSASPDLLAPPRGGLWARILAGALGLGLGALPTRASAAPPPPTSSSIPADAEADADGDDAAPPPGDADATTPAPAEATSSGTSSGAADPSTSGAAEVRADSATAALETKASDRPKASGRGAPHDPNTPPDYAQGFHFGSYGRITSGGDATGRPGRNADIVAFGSRLDEQSYAELEVRREDYWEATDSYTRAVITLAFTNPIFHYTGKFDASIGIRNLYIEAADLGVKGLRVWMGSRMYRGDDIYLLNFWPLDNLNTVGGGVGYWFKRGTVFKVHAGLNQPNNGFFKQVVDRPPVQNQLGATEVAILDRQKLITSAKLEHTAPAGESGGIKATVYGEFHWTGKGQREIADQVYEALPADKGFVVGAQGSAFTGKRSTHLNLVVRYARGLATYGEFNAPVQLAPDRTSKGAQELLFALSGNWERGPFGVMLGSYYRIFRNAAAGLDFHDLNEGIAIVRPQVWLGKRKFAGIALEASFQAQQRGSIVLGDDGSASPLFGKVGRVGVIPFLTPGGQGAFTRPHFQLIYLLTARNADARALYVPEDVFARRSVDHFIAITAEWWFGSTSYFRD
ncbi:MAG: carbohydrate porin [Nannocystaceae bacterium]